MRSVASLLLCCGALLAQDLATVEAAIGKRMAATIPFYLEWTEQLVDRGAVVRETRGRIAYDRKRSATWKVEDTTGRPWLWFQLWDGTHSIELHGDGNGWSGSSRPDTIGSGPWGVVLFGLDLGTYANLGRSRFLGRETLGGFACEVWEREEWPRNRPVRRWLAVEHGYFPVQVVHYADKRRIEIASVFRVEELVALGDAWLPVRIRNPLVGREDARTLVTIDPATVRTTLTDADFELPTPRRVRHPDGRIERAGWWGALTLPGWAWLALEIAVAVAVVVIVHRVVTRVLTRRRARATRAGAPGERGIGTRGRY